MVDVDVSEGGIWYGLSGRAGGGGGDKTDCALASWRRQNGSRFAVLFDRAIVFRISKTGKRHSHVQVHAQAPGPASLCLCPLHNLSSLYSVFLSVFVWMPAAWAGGHEGQNHIGSRHTFQGTVQSEIAVLRAHELGQFHRIAVHRFRPNSALSHHYHAF